MLTREEVVFGNGGYVDAEKCEDAVTHNTKRKKDWIQNESQTLLKQEKFHSFTSTDQTP